jgi:hypothetical protein
MLQPKTKSQQVQTLITRIAVIAAIVIAVVLLYRWLYAPKQAEYVLDDTPLHVEEIRKILELNTIKFRDEVVVDSLELYKSEDEAFSGSLEKIIDYQQLKNGLTPSAIKRRLTLIMKGELLYGIDLKRKDFSVMPGKNNDLLIKIPEPELLSVNLTPENTEVFVENGHWKDYERQILQRKGRQKMIDAGEQLNLSEKAKAPLEKLLKQLIRTDRQLVFEYY